MNHKRNLLDDLNALAALQPDSAATQHAVERTRAALKEQLATSSVQPAVTPSFWKEGLLRPRNLAAIAAAAVLIFLVSQLIPSASSGNFAFAQVQEQVAKTKSVRYTETLKGSLPDGSPALMLVGHVKILDDRLMRSEGGVVADDTFLKKNPYFLGPWGPSTEIIDLNKKKKVTLYPEVKGYWSMDWGGTFANAYILPPEEEKKLQEKSEAARKKLEKENPEQAKKVTGDFVPGEPNWDQSVPFPQLDIYELIRHVPTDKAQQLPEKTIGGKQVVGFLVEQTLKNPAGEGNTNWRHTWWVDPTTKLPVQMGISWHSSDPYDAGSEKVISDIVFNAPLDPALFSIDLPAGYTDLGTESKKAEEKWRAISQNPNRMNSMQFTQLENIKTADGRQAPELLKHVTILDGHLKREEITIKPADNSAAPLPAGIQPHISIQDSKQHKTIVLLPDKKEFIDPAKTPFTTDYLQWAAEQTQANRAANNRIFAELDFPDEKATRLPIKTVDGGLVYGKFADEKTQRGQFTDTRQWTFWIDLFTTHIIRGEFSLRSTDPAVGQVDYVLRDFSEGAPVDRALFSTDPPTGYKQISATEPPQRALADDNQKHFEFTFAEVQEEVAKTKSVQFKQSTKATANNEITYEDSGQMAILGANLSREEIHVKKQPKSEEALRKNHSIMITNSKTKTSLYLYPEEKEYFLVISGNMLPGPDLYRKFHDVPADRTKRLPEKVLNGKPVVGFVLVETVDHPNDNTQWAETTTYWVDVATKLPIQIEYQGRNNKPGAHEGYETVRTDFVFDAPLDESLFSTDPPKGWKDVSQRYVVPIK